MTADTVANMLWGLSLLLLGIIIVEAIAHNRSRSSLNDANEKIGHLRAEIEELKRVHAQRIREKEEEIYNLEIHCKKKLAEQNDHIALLADKLGNIERYKKLVEW